MNSFEAAEAESTEEEERTAEGSPVADTLPEGNLVAAGKRPFHKYPAPGNLLFNPKSNRSNSRKSQHNSVNMQQFKKINK